MTQSKWPLTSGIFVNVQTFNSQVNAKVSEFMEESIFNGNSFKNNISCPPLCCPSQVDTPHVMFILMLCSKLQGTGYYKQVRRFLNNNGQLRNGNIVFRTLPWILKGLFLAPSRCIWTFWDVDSCLMYIETRSYIGVGSQILNKKPER